MGDPRKTRKHFKRPLRIWDKSNLEREKALKETYGLKNKQEIWKTETILSKKRHSARSMLALPMEERMKRQQQLLQSLARIGVLDEKASLDDVLTLSVESFLERRLQTIVWRKGLANTAKQARQFITHGHIAIDGKRVSAPSYVVTGAEEAKIGYYAGKKMVISQAVEEKKKGKEEKKTVKEEFEEARPAEGEKTGKEEKKGTGKEKEEKRPGTVKEEKPEKEKKEKRQGEEWKAAEKKGELK